MALDFASIAFDEKEDIIKITFPGLIRSI